MEKIVRVGEVSMALEKGQEEEEAEAVGRMLETHASRVRAPGVAKRLWVAVRFLHLQASRRRLMDLADVMSRLYVAKHRQLPRLPPLPLHPLASAQGNRLFRPRSRARADGAAGGCYGGAG